MKPDSRQSKPVVLDPEWDLVGCFHEDYNLLCAAFSGLNHAMECDAHKPEARAAMRWAERVETSAWALKQKIEEALS